MKFQAGHLRIVLVLLALAVLYNVWVFFRPSAVKTPAQTQEEAAIAQIKAGRQVGPTAPVVGAAMPGRGGEPHVDPVNIPAPPAVDTAKEPSWGRDAFLYGLETRDEPVVRTAAAPTTDPTVSSILYAPGRQLAFIGGRIYKVGDRVNGAEIVEITRDAVVFTMASGDKRRVGLHDAGPRLWLRQ
jgi:hypothetical protein